MGVCYYLVREDNETLFDLNKGPWSREAGDAIGADWPPDYLAELYRRVLEWAAGQPIYMVNDCGDTYDELCDARGFRVTGSRFDDHYQLRAGVSWDEPP